jgi:peroxiredoxin
MRHSRIFSKLMLGMVLIALPIAGGASSQLSIGDPVPDVSVPDENGAAHKLSDHRGKVVVFEWTNPDCPFVQRHYGADTMEKLSAELGATGVVWYAVNSTHYNKPSDTIAWKKEQGFQYATLQDNDGKLGHLMGARTTPHMFVVGPDGKLAYAGAIDDDPRGRADQPKNYVANATQSILAGAALDPKSTEPYGCSVKYASN